MVAGEHYRFSPTRKPRDTLYGAGRDGPVSVLQDWWYEKSDPKPMCLSTTQTAATCLISDRSSGGRGAPHMPPRPSCCCRRRAPDRAAEAWRSQDEMARQRAVPVAELETSQALPVVSSLILDASTVPFDAVSGIGQRRSRWRWTATGDARTLSSHNPASTRTGSSATAR